MPIRVEPTHEVVRGAAGRVGEDTLPRFLERGEPAEEHLSGIEHGRRFRSANYAAANRARGQLNPDLPTCRALGACIEVGTSQPPSGSVQGRVDVARGLRTGRLPALAAA